MNIDDVDLPNAAADAAENAGGDGTGEQSSSLDVSFLTFWKGLEEILRKCKGKLLLSSNVSAGVANGT